MLVIGCDRPKPPPSAQQQQPESATTQSVPAAAEHRPTTQQLLAGEQVRMPLRAIPFSVSVPKGWEVKANAGIINLQGPTPAGTAQIQVSRHVAPISQHAERLIEGAKKDVTANPSPYALAEVRNLNNGIRCLEYRTVSRNPTGGPTIDASGRQIAPTATPMQWKITAFLPRGNDTDLCEISFTDLTREQFDIDRELLEKIFASLQYDPQAASS
jgi:hypothetical protein